MCARAGGSTVRTPGPAGEVSVNKLDASYALPLIAYPCLPSRQTRDLQPAYQDACVDAQLCVQVLVFKEGCRQAPWKLTPERSKASAMAKGR